MSFLLTSSNASLCSGRAAHHIISQQALGVLKSNGCNASQAGCKYMWWGPAPTRVKRTMLKDSREATISPTVMWLQCGTGRAGGKRTRAMASDGGVGGPGPQCGQLQCAAERLYRLRQWRAGA